MHPVMLSLLLFVTLGAYVDATPTSLSNTTLRAVTYSTTDSYASSSVSKAAEVSARQIALPQITLNSTVTLKVWVLLFVLLPWLVCIVVLLRYGFGDWRKKHRKLKNMNSGGGDGGGGDF
jgi:hypothetical protein